MRARAFSIAAAFAAATALAACSDQPTSPQALSHPGDHAVAGKNDKDKTKPNKQRAALLTNVPVSGALSDGGSFVGTFTARHIALDEATRTLIVTGMLTGTATAADGATTAINQLVTAPGSTLSRAAGAAGAAATLVRPVAMQVTCDVLFLDLGPLHLDLLGLTVDLAEVILDINAVSGAGNLLGNLLCAVVGLLDGFGLLAAITQLLDSINAILAGLQGIGGLINQVPAGLTSDIGFQVHT